MTLMKHLHCPRQRATGCALWREGAPRLDRWAIALSWLLLSMAGPAAAAQPAGASPPLKVLFVTGGGWHDYAKQEPYLTAKLAQLINVTFVVANGLDLLRNPKFAEACDVVFYDLCLEEAPDEVIQNALQAARSGKPAVLLHCSIHSFKKSPRVRQWEAFCGMTSKVHDPFGPFPVTKADENSPITKLFPKDWKTPGDELYQTIAIAVESHPLLRAKSPHDGCEHVVCWTRQFGEGRVFATTLGHDMNTCASPEFLRLLANGVLWASGKLEPDGQPAAGYPAPPAKK